MHETRPTQQYYVLLPLCIVVKVGTFAKTQRKILKDIITMK